MAELQDKEVNCVDCGQDFTLTAGEQEFYRTRELHEPKRCSSCRREKKRRNESRF